MARESEEEIEALKLLLGHGAMHWLVFALVFLLCGCTFLSLRLPPFPSPSLCRPLTSLTTSPFSALPDPAFSPFALLIFLSSNHQLIGGIDSRPTTSRIESSRILHPHHLFIPQGGNNSKRSWPPATPSPRIAVRYCFLLSLFKQCSKARQFKL